MLNPKIIIQNVVASATLKHRIDLNAIVRAFPNVEYRPQLFPGLVFRLKKPKTGTLLFNNGKMVCTGAKSVAKAEKAIKTIVKELKKEKIIILGGNPEVSIHNIVASVNLGDVLVDIETCIYILDNLGMSIMYEPEQFPGVIVHMNQPKVVFLIFSKGKLVCVGAKKEEDIYRAAAKLMAILDENKLVI